MMARQLTSTLAARDFSCGQIKLSIYVSHEKTGEFPRFFYIQSCVPMSRKIFRLSVAVLAFLLVSALQPVQTITKISASFTSRSVREGKTVSIRAELCYATTGRMVTHFSDPFQQYVINNSRGEISIYDPKKNTVIQQQNFTYGTETTQFYFFLNNKKEDLGLKQMGFIFKNIRSEKDLLISRWIAPMQFSKQLKELELVHRNGNPIYMKYVNGQDKTIKKVFYYNYQNLNGTDFPTAITQIDYIANDSIISKTSYTDIRVNEAANANLLDFKVPATAKTLR